MRSINRTELKCKDCEKYRQRLKNVKRKKGGNTSHNSSHASSSGKARRPPPPYNPTQPQLFLGLHHHFTLLITLICRPDEPKYEEKERFGTEIQPIMEEYATVKCGIKYLMK